MSKKYRMITRKEFENINKGALDISKLFNESIFELAKGVNKFSKAINELNNTAKSLKIDG